MDRRTFISGLTLGLLAAPLVVEAQQAGRVYRIGLLGLASASDRSGVAALREGLKDLGYEEGKNLVIESRWAEGQYDRLPGFAAELVRLKVDVIVTYGTPGALAAKQATKTIPVVVAIMGDAVATGVVASLARPGGNITGSQFHFPQIMVKRIGLAPVWWTSRLRGNETRCSRLDGCPRSSLEDTRDDGDRGDGGRRGG